MTRKEEILILLETHKIEYRLIEHEPVRTSAEAAKVRGVELMTGAKSMVVKAKNDFILVILCAHQRISWKSLRQLLNTKDVRFATEAEAESITHVQMGSVPPFGNILGLNSYLDKQLLENEFIYFNPGSKTHSIRMRTKDLLSLTNPHIVSIADPVLYPSA